MDILSNKPRFNYISNKFSGLSGSKNSVLEHVTLDSASRWKARDLKEKFNWNKFCAIIETNTGTKSNVLKQFQSLRNLSKELVGEDKSSEVIDETCLFLIQLYITNNEIQKKHMILKKKFGTVSLNQAKEILNVIDQAMSNLPESARSELKDAFKSQETSEKNIYNELNILFNEISECNSLELSLLRPFSDDCSNLNFSMVYDESYKNGIENKLNKKQMFGESWLVNEIKQSYGSTHPAGMSPEEFSRTIKTLLASSKCNEELQNEMFDLMGFDRFELIQTFLEVRNEIIYCHSIEERQRINNGHLISSDSVLDQKRPMLGCQILVQSEQEKLILKQIRKEEKKLGKLAQAYKDDSEDDDIEINPLEMRAKRQAALKAGGNTPPTRESITRSSPQKEYPNVYDLQAKAKQTAGYISGLKMMLPEGVVRIDTKTYEEVNIPISEPAPTSVGKKLIPINSLDEIGQMAFQGVKNLNRIQSVVFDTAYHSNENLLICAPTGAGKTNIALLTVVNTLRQHLQNGVLQRNQFKIVYVAPMKALAAEMTANFSSKLNGLGITVKELTGDMQLTKTEIIDTQMLVTTPEKWDVVTRKSTGDIALANLVKLLIIDEVHLLHGDRGPVVEAIVARTLRQVESSQSMIRIVGLSATLPNYLDVATFLRVNPYKGLFYFDSRFRPVPLSQTFIGVKAVKPLQQMADMDNVCYNKVLEMVQKGYQVMVFVHARNATVRTANVFQTMAQTHGHMKYFQPEESSMVGLARKAFSKAKTKQLSELFQNGFSVHHAGLLRSDRSMVEKYFGEGLIKVLVCTSTLAWGVNLPAHAVVIKGTEIYDAKHGSFIDLGILDVLQIFGRAGRPQFDTSGHGTIITSHDKLSHYLSLLTNQFPIESNFISCLADNLNAEVTLGTISNIDEAVKWLSYTYLYVRMRLNPHVYGIPYQEIQDDPILAKRRRDLIEAAAKSLDKAKMLRYDSRTSDLNVTDLGRTSSHFYIKYNTVETFNELLQATMSFEEIFSMISQAQEFEQLKIRPDELDELDTLTKENCEVAVRGGSENCHGKVNILLQTFLSRGRVNSFSLQSDLSYITQNAVRIARALFEVMLRKNNPLMASAFLKICQMFELQQWDFESEMRQFTILTHDIIEKIEHRSLDVYKLRDMDSKEIGIILRHAKMGEIVKRCALEFPMVELNATLHPITRAILKIRLEITGNFRWNDKVHGRSAEAFWIWIEDPETNYMYHSEYFILTKKQVVLKETQELVMTIPLNEPLPTQYYVKVSNDRWLGSTNVLPLSFQHLILPRTHPPHTSLLELQPLPVTALKNAELELLYPFTHFNPVQSQIFHCLYHTNNNVLLGAPTGSGKTIAAEIAMFRVFKQFPGKKVVYIAPLKALVRERIEDWKVRLQQKLGYSVVELTGDVTPDARTIASSDVIVTTPEKWDGISRSWQNRAYVRDVALIIIDEIHLLGEDRGPVLEVIVSRTGFISTRTSCKVRIVGLSTALANANDLARWLNIEETGLYNFKPAVRPVPLEVHINGFPGKHYCPRMATMNRPTFQAIRQYSPSKPALIFVSSRRQTRLTALDLIAYLAAENNPKQWLHMPEDEMVLIVGGIKDTNLKLTLAFGIGLHHAGLHERDRKTVEELFVNQKIQILLATSTLAWGVNFPAHLVVIKGTEYYDGKVRRYVDMPITDVLQMMGRAGRPQFDTHGTAVVLVHDMKKGFYKRFLYEPFPVESSLLPVLADHLNAEIVAGTITSRQKAVDYLTWTYFFHRLVINPTYYGLETLEEIDIDVFLTKLIEKTLCTLKSAYCINIHEDDRTVSTTCMGRIASFYYLSHETMSYFKTELNAYSDMEKLLDILSHAHEYSTLPVRHNEDLINGELAKTCPLPVDSLSLDSSFTKTFLLLQAHLSRLHLPCPDYYTDLKSVLDQAIRILQAMIDVCGNHGWLCTTLRLQLLLQSTVQARWAKDSPLLILPNLEAHHLYLFRSTSEFQTLPGLMKASYNQLANILRDEFDEGQIEQLHKVLTRLPKLKIDLSISDCKGGKNEAVQIDGTTPLTVFAEQEYTLYIKMTRLNKSVEKKAYAPKFPKPKDDGWFLTLGQIDSAELWALKRVPSVHYRSDQQLEFSTPSKKGPVILTLYIFSDTYLGLDQQYSFNLDVIPYSEPSQSCPM
uniref:U5 small nuclear ribonucleoprotein 200 kDa helicase n=2 Tax=Clastoptera arizonana TaxID=38151 RepID=A0A1B6DYT0_9HEMI